MRRSALLVSLLSASLVMAGCATNGYSNTAKGAAIGGVVGAVAGKATGNHKDKRLVIGAAVIEVFISQRQTYRTQDDMARIQENARFVEELDV